MYGIRLPCLVCSTVKGRTSQGSARLGTRTKELLCTASLDPCKGLYRRKGKQVIGRAPLLGECFDPELYASYPRGTELRVPRVKPVERQVEARKDVDVQITPVRCVKGRKTHRSSY